MQNPHKILGIAENATKDEIKKAYRNLAKKYHPDLNPGSIESEERFKDIASAYETLTEADKMKEYELNKDMKNNSSRTFYKDHFDNPTANSKYYNSSGHADFLDSDNIFSHFFDGAIAGKNSPFKKKKADSYYRINVSLEEAANGCMKKITFPDGKVLEVKIPAGIEDKQSLKLAKQGGQSTEKEDAGDAYIQILIEPHPNFKIIGKNIYFDIELPLKIAILGGQIAVPTLYGKFMLTIPKWSNSGNVLRMKNMGYPGVKGKGDQLVKLEILLPDKISENCEMLEKLANSLR